MTVYLYCEGATDYAVIPFLMKKALKMPDLDVKWIKRPALKKVSLHRKSDVKISGHYKFVKALAAFSSREGVKHIAYHQDADGQYSEIYNAITSEFRPLEGKGFRCLAIVPKEMIESWLLADGNAYPAKPERPKLPFRPEGIWGQKQNINSNYPKHYLARVLAQFGLLGALDTYAQIAENIDIEILKNRCPESFGQFCADIQSFRLGSQ